MTNQETSGGHRRRRMAQVTLWAVVAALAGGCAGRKPEIPEPRPMVNYMGFRLRPAKARLDSINTWVTKEQEIISKDPQFWILDNATGDENAFPWSHMRISSDTAMVYYYRGVPESQLPFDIYAHLHLMAKMGRLAEWLPEAPAATGYDLERAILSRVSDSWLLARTVYDGAPYAPLDELVYAKEDGYLDAFIFTARPDQFAEARAKWAREHPDAPAKYRAWFLKTFNKEPPGLGGR